MTPEEQAAADAKAAADKVAADKAAADAKAVADKVAADKAAADKLASEDKTTYDAAYVKKLREEAADARTEAAAAKAEHKKAQDALDAIEREKLEAQGKHKEAADAAEVRAKKAEERAEKIQQDADKRHIDAEIKLAAQAAGAVEPADVLLFINRENIKLDGSDVVGATEAVAALKESKKHLFQETSTEEDTAAKARRRNVAPPANSKGADKVDAFKQTPEDFARSWDSAGRKAA